MGIVAAISLLCLYVSLVVYVYVEERLYPDRSDLYLQLPSPLLLISDEVIESSPEIVLRLRSPREIHSQERLDALRSTS